MSSLNQAVITSWNFVSFVSKLSDKWLWTWTENSFRYTLSEYPILLSTLSRPFSHGDQGILFPWSSGYSFFISNIFNICLKSPEPGVKNADLTFAKNVYLVHGSHSLDFLILIGSFHRLVAPHWPRSSDSNCYSETFPIVTHVLILVCKVCPLYSLVHKQIVTSLPIRVYQPVNTMRSVKRHFHGM